MLPIDSFPTYDCHVIKSYLTRIGCIFNAVVHLNKWIKENTKRNIVELFTNKMYMVHYTRLVGFEIPCKLTRIYFSNWMNGNIFIDIQRYKIKTYLTTHRKLKNLIVEVIHITYWFYFSVKYMMIGILIWWLFLFFTNIYILPTLSVF